MSFAASTGFIGERRAAQAGRRAARRRAACRLGARLLLAPPQIVAQRRRQPRVAPGAIRSFARGEVRTLAHKAMQPKRCGAVKHRALTLLMAEP
jgi:hypothetical protein